MSKIHIVKAEILRREYEFNKENDGKIRVFAVNVENAVEMVHIAKNLKTPINKGGFLTYIAGIENARSAVDSGEKTIVFHEDIGLSYPETKEVVLKKYPTIKFFDGNKIPRS